MYKEQEEFLTTVSTYLKTGSDKQIKTLRDFETFYSLATLTDYRIRLKQTILTFEKETTVEAQIHVRTANYLIRTIEFIFRTYELLNHDIK